MGKASITINGAEEKNIFPAMTIGVSAAASGDEVVLFILPSALPAFKKGGLEKLNDAAENLPDLIAMVDGLKSLNASFLVCELGFDVHGLEEKDLYDFCEVVGATTFVARAGGSDLTLSF